MNIPKSTVKEPLEFFQWIFEEQNFRQYKHDFFINYDKGYQNVEFNKDEITYWNNVSEYEDTNFGIEFQRILNRKLKLSKRLIDESISAIFFEDNSPNRFLSYLQTIINEIKQSVSLIMNYYPYSSGKDSTLIIDEYPYINEILTELDKYIEYKLSTLDTNKKANIKLQFYYRGNKSALENMRKYLEDKKHFIDSTDDFIAIFTQKPFTTKINWTYFKHALHYFIDELSDCKGMKFDKKKKWIITAKYFTWKEKEIAPQDIKTNDKIPKQAVIAIIKEAIQKL